MTAVYIVAVALVFVAVVAIIVGRRRRKFVPYYDFYRLGEPVEGEQRSPSAPRGGTEDQP